MDTKNTSEKKADLNAVDLLLYLFYQWKWFVISLVICFGLSYYKYAKSPYIFFSSIKVLFKNPGDVNASAVGRPMVGLDRYSNAINTVNIANEMQLLHSKDLLKEVIYRSHANISYVAKEKFRRINYYGSSPIDVCFLDSIKIPSTSFCISLYDRNFVKLSNFNNRKTNEIVAPMNKILDTDAGRIIIRPNKNFSESWYGKKLQVVEESVEALVRYLHSTISVEQKEEDASVLTLALKDESPVRAQMILKTLINVYNDDARNGKRRIADITANFINERIYMIGRELGGVESNLASFKRANKLVDPTASASMYMGESQGYQKDVMDKELQLRLAKYMRNYLTNPAKSKEPIPVNMGIEGGNIEEQITQYNTLLLRIERLGNNLDENPVVQDLKSVLHNQKQVILQSLDNYIRTLSIHRTDVRSRDMAAQSKMSAMPEKEGEMMSIERQQKIKDNLYTFLLNKREENALTQAMADTNARIIDSSDGDEIPIGPKRSKYIMLSILLGLFCPSVILLSKLFLSTRVSSRKDIEDVINVPFLGEIPLENKEKHGKKNQKDTEINDKGIVSEAFRILRTNMAFMLKKKEEAQFITITSFNAGSGKTFISMRLARSLALTKKKVLLVDLDIRKGTLSHASRLDKMGVTNYLADTTVLVENIIQKGRDGNVDMISSGHVAPNPAELLMSDRLDELMKSVSVLYDYIIVDNVPVGGIADAIITNHIADLTIFVVRAGMLDRRQLPDIEKLFDDGLLKNLSVVLNGSKRNPHRYGYGYNRYGYGYGYGYGYEDVK